jgi:hypothetical protein
VGNRSPYPDPEAWHGHPGHVHHGQDALATSRGGPNAVRPYSARKQFGARVESRGFDQRNPSSASHLITFSLGDGIFVNRGPMQELNFAAIELQQVLRKREETDGES